MTFHSLEKLSHLIEGYRRTFRVGGIELIVFVVDGKTVIINNRCPHLGKPLHQGVLDSCNRVLRCPHHGLEFDLVTGKNVNGGPAVCNPLQLYKPVYRESVLGVEVS